MPLAKFLNKIVGESPRVVALIHCDRRNISKESWIGLQNSRYDHLIGKTRRIDSAVYHVVENAGGKFESFLGEEAVGTKSVSNRQRWEETHSWEKSSCNNVRNNTSFKGDIFGVEIWGTRTRRVRGEDPFCLCKGHFKLRGLIVFYWIRKARVMNFKNFFQNITVQKNSFTENWGFHFTRLRGTEICIE